MDPLWIAVCCGAALLLVYLLILLVPRKIVDIPKTGKWAVVTGATDGIGKCFTHELARLGMNVVLISRNVDKLEICAGEIREKFTVQTRIIQVDFTSSDEKMYSRIRRELAGMDIGVLVNNVGMIHRHPDYLHLLDEHHGYDFQNIVNCNVTSAVNMTRIVLSGMVARRRGLIINVSSVLSQLPSPFVTMYAACKSFLAKFSTDLDLEYRGMGVHVHLLRTGYVATKLSGVDTMVGFVPTPEAYVRTALKRVAWSRDCDGHFGHWMTRFWGRFAWTVCPYVMEKSIRYVYLRARNERMASCDKCSTSPNAPAGAV